MQNQCSWWREPVKKGFLILGCFLFIIILLGVYLIYQLPDIKGLPCTQWPLPMYIYTKEGECIAEFGPRQHQTIKIEEVPLLLKQSFFAIEDKRFLEHRGVDLKGLLRASVELLTTGRKSQGGSTITMQVARNYYLTREKTFLRKLKEILIAIKIEREFTKEQILEFYLNKIYMGHRTFGVGTATQFYFKKSLDQLSIAQMALLAGMPQAPAVLNPIKSIEAAKKRRDLVLYRLYHLGFITYEDYQKALVEEIFVPIPIATDQSSHVLAPYVADMAKIATYKILGAQAEKGLHVYTTIEGRTQQLADEALVTSLFEYDQNHGYRGPEQHIKLGANHHSKIVDILKRFSTIYRLQPAVVIACDMQTVTAMLSTGEVVIIKRSGWEWIVEGKKEVVSDIFKSGDVIRVYQKESEWGVGQIPQVQGALVALNPKDGSIKALSGGFSYTLSQFNRATQAMRQTGSSFKPFVYAASFEKGYNLSDVFNDAPLVFDIPDKLMPWRPQNATQSFDGLTRLRVALVMSINLVTIRLLQAVGISDAFQVIKRFGFDTSVWPNNLSLALGSVEATPLEMARGYAVFANGGYRITPYIIDHITDYQGHLVYQANPLQAPSADSKALSLSEIHASDAPQKMAPQVVSNEVAFIVNSALKGVIPYSGSKIAKYLEREDLAGKTGTTNNSVDSWFIGYNSDYVASVWMGLDQRQPLYEYAHTTALPLWARFMKPVLQGVPEKPLLKPKGIIILPMNPETGVPTKRAGPDTLYEYFQASSLKRYKSSTGLLDSSIQSSTFSEIPLF